MIHDLNEAIARYEDALSSVYQSFVLGGASSNSKNRPAEIEEISWGQDEHPSAKNLIVLSGLSGSGKTTIGKKLAAEYGYKKLRNVYTRPARPNETEADGIFISEATFSDWKRKGEFITTSYTNGVWHGLLLEELERVQQLNQPVWADKSVSSLGRLYPHLPEARLVYVLAPSFEELWGRLTKREAANGMKHDELQKRIEEEINELRASIELPYRYVVNDSLDRVIERLLR